VSVFGQKEVDYPMSYPLRASNLLTFAWLVATTAGIAGASEPLIEHQSGASPRIERGAVERPSQVTNQYQAALQNNHSNSLEIPVAESFQGCWEGAPKKDDCTIERVGLGPNWGGVIIATYRLCFERPNNADWKVTLAKAHFTDTAGAEIQNSTVRVKSVDHEVVKLKSLTWASETFGILPRRTTEIAASSDLTCSMDGNRLRVSAKTLNDLNGQPWMATSWSAYFDRSQ
jgi:hypothetical protein